MAPRRDLCRDPVGDVRGQRRRRGRAGLIAGTVLVFIPSLGAFITPDLLGGAKSVMIGNFIQNQFAQLNQPFGSALSLILTAAVLLLLAIAFKSGLKSSEFA